MALLPQAGPPSPQGGQAHCRAVQKPSFKRVLRVTATQRAALLLLLHVGGEIGPSCSSRLLIPHVPAPDEGSCPWQGWSWVLAIQMPLPGSEAAWLLVVPRGGCLPLRSWRRKLGFAASEGEDAEMFEGSVLWRGEALLLPVSSRSKLMCLATMLVGKTLPLLQGEETVVYSV